MQKVYTQLSYTHSLLFSRITPDFDSSDLLFFEKVFDYEMANFRVMEQNPVFIEYINGYYDLERKEFFEKNFNGVTKFYKNLNFSEKERLIFDFGLYGNYPRSVTNNLITIFFSDDIYQQKISCFLIENKPSIIPNGFIFINLIDVFILVEKKELIQFKGKLLLEIIGDSVLSLNEYKWFIFIAINKQENFSII